MFKILKKCCTLSLLVIISLASVCTKDSAMQYDSILSQITSRNPEYEECSTIVFGNIDFVLEIHSFEIPILNYVLKPEYPFRNESYFKKEWNEEELNYYWLKIKYGRQCTLGIVPAPNFYVRPTTVDITSVFLYLRVLRPSKDYFIFVGTDFEQLSNFISNNELSFVQDLKYKYGLVLPSLKIPEARLISPCGAPLFSSECDLLLRRKRFRFTALYGSQQLRIPKGQIATSENGLGAGIYYQMLKSASEVYNFTFELTFSGHGGASGFKSNGTWYGALGEVFNREADVGIGSAMAAKRLSIVDATSPTSRIKYKFYIRRPPLSTRWTALFRPLDGIVWALALSITCISIPVYHVFAKSSSGSKPANQKSSFIKSIVDLVTTTAVFYRMALEQSWNEHGAGTGTRRRYIVCLYAIFCLVLTTSYRSKLISFLTFRTSDPVPLTHAALARTDYKIFFRYYGGVAYEYYRNSNLADDRRIFKRAIVKNTSYECMMSAALIDNSACFDYDIAADYVMLTNTTLYATRRDADTTDSQYFVTSDTFQVSAMNAWFTRKGSPLLQHFDKFILKVDSFGLSDYWSKTDLAASSTEGAKWMRSQTNDSPIKTRLVEAVENLRTNGRPLNRKVFRGAGIILGAGLCISLLVWIAEHNIYSIS